MNNPPQATIDTYDKAWNAMDFDALAALWHPDETEIYYVAEEIDSPLYTFDDVVKYWSQTAATIESVSIWLSNLRCKHLSDSLATATFDMHVDASMRGFKQQGFKPVGSDVRVSAILREKDGQWLFIHYAEAAMGALPFIRRVYNANVRQA